VHVSAKTANLAIGVLFAIGSVCFLVGPFPGYLQLVGSSADGVTFFVGSIFFTAAALLQLATTGIVGGGRIDWWAGGIQFAGTLCFNVSTHAALQDSLDTSATDRLVWRPDVYGSVCFLVASYLAYVSASGGYGWHRRASKEWRIAVANMLGSIAFGIAAIAGYVVPATGDVLALGAANFTTSVGALCFLIGAVVLLPRSSSGREAAVAQ
jgi:YrhK-like protein